MASGRRLIRFMEDDRPQITQGSERNPKRLDLNGKRLLICEEALLDYNGHFYSWVKAIRAINRNAGVDVIVAAGKNVTPEIRDEMDVYPTFSRNNWSDIYNSRGRAGRALGVIEHNWIVYREAAKLLNKTGPVDCILLPAVRVYHLLAWHWLCKRYMGTRFKRLVLFLLNSHAVYNDDFSAYHFKRSSNLMRRMLRSFRSHVEAGSVVLCGDSHITCGEFERFSGLPFKVFPSPGAALNRTDTAAPRESESAKAADGPVFAMLGVSYFDKGIDLLQQAILKYFENQPESKARFVLQWSKAAIDYDGNLIEINSRLREMPQVEFIERTLSDSEYRSYFQQADFIVLPYRRAVYFNRISGVAVEAACSGIPMIVTENTWLDWAVREFGAGVTVKDRDADDLLDKIDYCCEHWEELGRRARSKQAVALEYNSAERYLQCQWG